MRRFSPLRQIGILVLAAALSLPGAFASQAGAVSQTEVPLTLHLDVNGRRTSLYDGYSSYLLGFRVSDYDTFTVTKDSIEVNLDDVMMNYYLITYNGETQKNLECTVHGIKEGTSYPVVRPETVERERETGMLYDSLDRCYIVEFVYKDAKESQYFAVYPEDVMNTYRNILLGKWNKDTKGWRYTYQGEDLISWALINDKWYFFGTDGFMKTGWQEYKGSLYYLDPETGQMRTNCTIDGFELDGSGRKI